MPIVYGSDNRDSSSEVNSILEKSRILEHIQATLHFSKSNLPQSARLLYFTDPVSEFKTKIQRRRQLSDGDNIEIKTKYV